MHSKAEAVACRTLKINIVFIARDGHGISKCSPCPSMVFLMLPGPSIRFRAFFLGWRVRMSVIWTVEILKSAKSGRKSMRPFVKNFGIRFYQKM